MHKYILGFDIGGTKCAVLLADVSRGIALMDRMAFPTETDKGFEQAYSRLFDTARAILSKNKVERDSLTAIGISCGGPLDSKRGVILSPPHLPGWDEVHITADMEREFGAPAFLQNDANACALVEWKLGAGKGTRNMVFITMGTGFGAGIISEGRLVEGASSLGGELGHVRLKESGPEVFGKAGTVEVFCSGYGIALTAAEYAKELQKLGQTPLWMKADKLTAKLVGDYARQGDPYALEVFRRTGADLGRILAVVTDILNPERIVIGSIFARCEGFLRPEMERVWAAEALPGAVAACQVVTAGTGERIGDYASIMAACYPLGIDPAEWLKPDKPEVVARYERLFTRYPALEAVRPAVMDAFLLLRGAFSGGHKLLVCGNGGSAADSDHIVGELMKGFYLKRALGDRERRQYGAVAEKLQRALPAVSLTQHMALNSAFMNDVEPELIYAQQLYGYGRPGDVLLAISTSGNSKNVVAAAALAQKMGLRVIALTGASGGRLAGLADAAICAPAQETADVQELHLPIYHTLCAMLEEEYFGGAGQQ